MTAKATSSFYFAKGGSRKREVADVRPGENAFPRLLKGERLKGMVLPANFDTTIHYAAKMSGKVKPASLAALDEMIASFQKG